MSKTGKLCVTLVRSPIGSRSSHRDTVRCLGLRRINQSRVLPDNSSVRGMVATVSYLVRCRDFEG